jgi:hypothetical protein
MARTTSYVVKIVKQELKVDNTFPQSFDVFAPYVFIELLIPPWVKS